MVLVDPKREQNPAGKKIQEVSKTPSGQQSSLTNMVDKVKAISQPETRADESALMTANKKAVANFKMVKYKKGVGKLKEAKTPGGVESPRNRKKVKNPGPKPQLITKWVKVVHKNYKSEKIKGETGRKVGDRVQEIDVEPIEGRFSKELNPSTIKSLKSESPEVILTIKGRPFPNSDVVVYKNKTQASDNEEL